MLFDRLELREITSLQAYSIIGNLRLSLMAKSKVMLYNGAHVVWSKAGARKNFYLEGTQQQIFDILQRLDQGHTGLTKP